MRHATTQTYLPSDAIGANGLLFPSSIQDSNFRTWHDAVARFEGCTGFLVSRGAHRQDCIYLHILGQHPTTRRTGASPISTSSYSIFFEALGAGRPRSGEVCTCVIPIIPFPVSRQRRMLRTQVCLKMYRNGQIELVQLLIITTIVK
jgi:hypothetical protein